MSAWGYRPVVVLSSLLQPDRIRHNPHHSQSSGEELEPILALNSLLRFDYHGFVGSDHHFASIVFELHCYLFSP